MGSLFLIPIFKGLAVVVVFPALFSLLGAWIIQGITKLICEFKPDYSISYKIFFFSWLVKAGGGLIALGILWVVPGLKYFLIPYTIITSIVVFWGIYMILRYYLIHPVLGAVNTLSVIVMSIVISGMVRIFVLLLKYIIPLV